MRDELSRQRENGTRERGMAASQSGFMLYYANLDPETADEIAIGEKGAESFGAYASASSGVLYGAEVPSETPLFHDVFNSGKKPPHMVITGDENTGKTALASTLLRRHALKGDKVFAIGVPSAFTPLDAPVHSFDTDYGANPFALRLPSVMADEQASYAAATAYREKKLYLAGLMDLLAARYGMEFPLTGMCDDILSNMIDKAYQFSGINIESGKGSSGGWNAAAMPTFENFRDLLVDFESCVSSFSTREKLSAWGKGHLTPTGTLSNKNSKKDRIVFSYYAQVILYGGVPWGREEIAVLHLLTRIAKAVCDDPEMQSMFDGGKPKAMSGFRNIIEAHTPLEAYVILEDIVGSIEPDDADSILLFDDILLSPSRLARKYTSAIWDKAGQRRMSIWVTQHDGTDGLGELVRKSATLIEMGDVDGKTAKNFGILKTPAGKYRFYALTSKAEGRGTGHHQPSRNQDGCSLAVIDEAAFAGFCQKLSLEDGDRDRIMKMMLVALTAMQYHDAVEYDDIVRFWTDRTWRNAVCGGLKGANASAIRQMAELGVRPSDISKLRSQSTRARTLSKRGYSVDTLYKQSQRAQSAHSVSVLDMKVASRAYLDGTMTLNEVMIEQHGLDTIRRFFVNVVVEDPFDKGLPSLVLCGAPALIDTESRLAEAIANEYGKRRNTSGSVYEISSFEKLDCSKAALEIGDRIGEPPGDDADEDARPHVLIYAPVPKTPAQSDTFEQLVGELRETGYAGKAAAVFHTCAPQEIPDGLSSCFNMMFVPVVPYDFSKSYERKRAALGFIALMTQTCSLKPINITADIAEMVPLLPMYSPADIRRLASIAYADCIADLGESGNVSYANVLRRMRPIVDDFVVYVDKVKDASRIALEYATLDSSTPGDTEKEGKRYLDYSAIELIGELLEK